MAAINIANCFMALMGAVLALFEWNAAKRREFLYLYMTAGKPDSEYFNAARERRHQFAFMLFAFLFLTLKEALTASVWNPLRNPRDLDTTFLLAEPWFVLIVGYLILLGPRPFPSKARLWLSVNLVVVMSLVALLSVLHLLVPSAMNLVHGLFVAARAATFVAYFAVNSLCLISIMERYEMLERDRHRFQRERSVVVAFLEDMGNAFSTAFDLNQVLQMIMNSSLRATSATSGAIFLRDGAGRLKAAISRGFFPPMYDETEPEHRARRTEILQRRMLEQHFNPNEGVVGEVATTGEQMLIEDVSRAGIIAGTMTEFMRNRSMVLVPLMSQNQNLGVMAVLNKDTATPFTADDQSMLQVLAGHAAFAIRNSEMVGQLAQKERLDRELQIARQIQQQLLPKQCPDIPGFELAALGEVAEEVGGDYYDFFPVDENRLGIVVADVSGKGIPAAMTMAITRSIFRSQSIGNRSAREVVTATNALLYPDLRRDMFVTAFYGILDIRHRSLAWCRAGHEPVIAIHSAGSMEVLAPSGAALGIADETEFGELIEERQIQFESGDAVLIYTDGITEAMDRSGEEFGLDRLKETMRNNGAPDTAAMVQNVEATIRAFVGTAPQHDDMTMVLVRAK
ncbi:MAG: SpoIIE family protein phosphatase [Armatimonadetes bacterium]|nr:SpoIIE family protein phosphatase [Armatimonadota bacterium]